MVLQQELLAALLAGEWSARSLAIFVLLRVSALALVLARCALAVHALGHLHFGRNQLHLDVVVVVLLVHLLLERLHDLLHLHGNVLVIVHVVQMMLLLLLLCTLLSLLLSALLCLLLSQHIGIDLLLHAPLHQLIVLVGREGQRSHRRNYLRRIRVALIRCLDGGCVSRRRFDRAIRIRLNLLRNDSLLRYGWCDLCRCRRGGHRLRQVLLIHHDHAAVVVFVAVLLDLLLHQNRAIGENVLNLKWV
jgi:hypothetical protein